MTQLRLVYPRRYERRLEEIYEHIAAENPAAAIRTIMRIREAVERLALFPSIGRSGRVDGTRELVIVSTPYIVPYRVKNDAVQIITILHSAQRWPSTFSGIV
ncbi:MAG: type II toxin-antitoxin system RelE/ParE family toxin [Alphaproteobacteria bacterium]|nr:type II toxin-antitoxin system RelE/ParE family toxin [Alphaproteobacteria bacterium]